MTWGAAARSWNGTPDSVRVWLGAPPIAMPQVSRLAVEVCPHGWGGDWPEGIRLGPFAQGPVERGKRLTREVFHDRMALSLAHQVPHGWLGRLATSRIGRRGLVGHKMQVAAVQGDTVLGGTGS